MKDIIFSTELAHKVRDGSKTMTRRTNGLEQVNKNPDKWFLAASFLDGCARFYTKDGDDITIYCPYGGVWDLLKMGETSLEITAFRAERLQAITLEDCIKEGIPHSTMANSNWSGPHWKFIKLWDSIKGKKYPWEFNPWVWVITYKIITPPTLEDLQCGGSKLRGEKCQNQK